jgi:hypothetical protein
MKAKITYAIFSTSSLAPFLSNERARTEARRGKVLISQEKRAITGKRGRREGLNVEAGDW